MALRPAARQGDLSTGHGCYPPRPAANGSSNVFINGRPAHRKGDMFEKHCCGKDCHIGATMTGSATVFINGIPAARVGERISCGDIIMTGSTNVGIG